MWLSEVCAELQYWSWKAPEVLSPRAAGKRNRWNSPRVYRRFFHSPGPEHPHLFQCWEMPANKAIGAAQRLEKASGGIPKKRMTLGQRIGILRP